MSGDVLILADEKGKAWDFADTIYNKLQDHPEKSVVYNQGNVGISKFPNKEIFIRVLNNVREKRCFYIHDSSMNPQDGFMSILQVNNALKRSSAIEINDVIPCMNYTRQDRMTEPRVPITAEIYIDCISKCSDRIITTDLHNPATTGFGKPKPFDNLKAYPVIIKHLRENYSKFLENAVLVAPDVGSAKRVESYAKRLKLGVVLAHKIRDKEGKIESITLVGDVKGKNTLITDDMIDKGGTLITAAEELKKAEAKIIYACATHGVFSQGFKKLEESPLEKIIITDSIPQKRDGKIEVVSLTDLFAETIHRISHGKSVSKLFDEDAEDKDEE